MDVFRKNGTGWMFLERAVQDGCFRKERYVMDVFRKNGTGWIFLERAVHEGCFRKERYRMDVFRKSGTRCSHILYPSPALPSNPLPLQYAGLLTHLSAKGQTTIPIEHRVGHGSKS